MAINMKKNLLMLLFCSMLAASCSADIQQHGNKPDTFLLDKVKIGQTSKPEVINMFGTPSSVTVFEEETWLYISSKRRQVAFLKPEELEREVVAITFDAKTDKVSNMFFAQKEDGVPLVVSSKETPTSGHSITMIEQMFGNVGRFEGK
jgi:outer membrane protein assembly factor BamE (lipoprotein component of BamABCDE complex)